MFIDEARIVVRSGKGGAGCVSFRREKFVPRGGPDGGNGGEGGNVILRAVTSVTTLLDLGRRRHFIAADGRPGSGNNCTGRCGRDLVVKMPVGTVVRQVPADGDPREGPILADLDRPGTEVVVAVGGKGGHGNKSFANATRQVPRYAQKGLPGEEHELYLELKLLADVGLVGLPNAGKSTLLARVSRATPKIADYPFTTLEPHLGIADLGDYSRLVIADIPGLIEGAHEGHGLGTEFLRHIERTRVLAHLVSAERESIEELARDYRTIEAELAAYSRTLAAKPRLVFLSKTDVVPAEDLPARVAALATAIGVEVRPLSAVTGAGVPEFLAAVRGLVGESWAELTEEAASTDR